MIDNDQLNTELVQFSCTAASKKQALRCLAQMAQESLGLNSDKVYSALNARELMGSTCVSTGVALPHARVEQLETMQLLVLQLAQPIQNDSSDWSEKEVKTVVCVLTPQEGAHSRNDIALNTSQAQQVLLRLARKLKNQQLSCALNDCCNHTSMKAFLMDCLQISNENAVQFAIETKRSKALASAQTVFS